MITEEFRKYQENKFNKYCKVIIKKTSFDCLRSRNRREKRFVSLESNDRITPVFGFYEDKYVTYSRTFYVKDIEVTIFDQEIADAMQFIIPNQRNVLLLSFFKDYRDVDIARLMGVDHKTVATRKEKAMRKLRELLEAKKYGC